jgi:hypothetical protein
MRPLLAALLVALALPACEDKPVPDDGFDTMQPMDVPADEPTACRDFRSCVQTCDEPTKYAVQANCEDAAADPDDDVVPGPECDSIDATIAACLAFCADEVPEATADDRDLADDASRCAARVEDINDQAVCDLLSDECDGE